MGSYHTRPRLELRAKQLKALISQLNYCRQNVPHYKALFEASGWDPKKLTSIDQVVELPLLDKAEVRAAPSTFRGINYPDGKVHKSFSSGSTGEPFASYFNPIAWYRKKFLIKLRARFACGMKLGERVAILECEDAATVAKRNRNSWLTDFLLQIRVFSLFQEGSELLEELKEFAPQNIYAYPSHLFELGMRGNDNEPLIPGLKRLFTSSEFLENGARGFIEKRFSAPIYDHYGSTEFKEVAWQCCEKDWYHINNDELLCEVVNEEGQSQIDVPGNIVVTDLRNRAMPLIRFKLGDIGVLSTDPCPCGYQGDSLKPLGGRSSDYLELPNGMQLSPFRFTTEIEYLFGLLQYQVVQLHPGEVLVKTVWITQPSTEVTEKVASIIRDAIADGSDNELSKTIKIDVEVCDQISNEENGKFKVVKRMF